MPVKTTETDGTNNQAATIVIGVIGTAIGLAGIVIGIIQVRATKRGSRRAQAADEEHALTPTASDSTPRSSNSHTDDTNDASCSFSKLSAELGGSNDEEQAPTVPTTTAP